MKIALASPIFPASIQHGLDQLKTMSAEAAAQGGEIICFPESYLPGYPLNDVTIEKQSPEVLTELLSQAQEILASCRIAAVLPMDWYENGKFLNVAHVISANGEYLGYQSKNQLDPSEDNTWDAGTDRKIFEIAGLKFGITICHEGFRYPESTRWAARNGAQLVFHPHLAGSDVKGSKPDTWGSMSSPYYEKAMMVRALENTVYFASCNYTFKYPESASSVIDPQGNCIAFQPYSEPGVLVTDINPALATGLIAGRLKTELY